MTQQIRTTGRWVVVLGLAAGWTAAASFDSLGADRPGGGTIVRVAQKQQPKKKGASKKGTAPVATDAMAAGDAATPKDDATPAGDDALSFRRDIAPILVANCVGCHTGTGAGITRGKLSMASFEKLMAGGKRGKDIVPGDPDSSHLVLMIKGEETPKMPPNNGQMSLADAAATKIEAWVKAGARLDAGLAATDPLSKYAASAADLRRAELAKLKPEDRDKVAQAAGLDRWKKATPTVPDVTPKGHFLGFGNLPGDRMGKLLTTLEPQYALANRLLGSSKGPALDPDQKVSVYVFKDRNTFVEFVRSVENQEVEATESARANLGVESPYVAAVDPANGGEEAAPAARKGARKGKKADDSAGGPERSLAGLVTEQLVAGAAARAGKPPKWVALGLGAYAASKVEGGSPYYRRLRDETLTNLQIGWPVKATEALGGNAPAETARAIGFGLFEYIAANVPPAALTAFLKVMLEGQNQLDDAITGCLGVDRQQFLEGSGQWLAERYGH